MSLKPLLILFSLTLLGACFKSPNSYAATIEKVKPTTLTLTDINTHIDRIIALDHNHLNIKNIEAIIDTQLHQREGHFDADFIIDESLIIHAQLAQHDKGNLTFLIELVTTLPSPEMLGQKAVDQYFDQLAKSQPQTIKTHCIPKENLFNYLLKTGWSPIETDFSSPLDDEGNFDFSFNDGRYLTLTIGQNCLEALQISTDTRPMVLGMPKSKN